MSDYNYVPRLSKQPSLLQAWHVTDSTEWVDDMSEWRSVYYGCIYTYILTVHAYTYGYGRRNQKWLRYSSVSLAVVAVT